jgi:hypothetical protein
VPSSSPARTFGQHVFLFARGDHQRDAGAHDNFGGLDFRFHAADGGFAGRAARQFFNRRINLFDDGNGFRIRLAEIFDDAVHGRQNHQQIRRQQRGDERGQFVVVAEFDFRERHGVVFVDDGNDAAAEQRDERVARVEMALVMFQVLVREQNLRDVQIVLAQKVFVNRHEPRLADSGAGLKFREFGGTRRVAERAHARADRAAGHEHDFLAGFPQRGDLRDELLQLRRINQFPAVGEHAGAEFDDKAETDLSGSRCTRGVKKIGARKKAKVRCRQFQNVQQCH